MRILCACVAVCLSSAALLAQDVLTVAPGAAIKVEYEDAQVRVLRFREAAGSKLPMHSHGPYVIVGLTDTASRYRFPDGKTSQQKTKAGQVLFSHPITHASENIGTTPYESVMVELKTQPAGTDLAGDGDMVKLNPDTCKVELDNEYVRVTRVSLPPGGKLAMHSHPSRSVVVAVTGGRTRFTTADGNSEDSTLAPGAVHANPPGQHSNENVGDKPSEAILIELKTTT